MAPNLTHLTNRSASSSASPVPGPRLLNICACLALGALLWASPSARAQDLDSTEPAPAGEGLVEDPTFGPLLVIERIDVVGNSSTAERLIRRAVPLAPGDALRAGDPRFRKARYKLLAMGFFLEVDIDLRKGSERGKVIVVVRVKERGTVVLNSLFFGNSPSSPWWLGLDLTERNFIGSGLGVGGGLVYAGKGDIDGAEDQLAARLRLFDTSILGSIFGAYGEILHNRGSEPYRVQGDTSDAGAGNFRAFSYTRTGLQAGMTADITPLSNLEVGGRLEWVDADVPLASTRTLVDGSVVPVDIGIEPGRSRVVSVSVGFDRDTRSDAVLPYNGDRIVIIGEFGATWMGGSYNYAVALARYQNWWPIATRKHVLSVHVTGGLVLGEAPRFDRLHASDFNRLLASRSHGLVMSTNASPDFLGTEADESTYGEVGGSAVLEYSYQLFRSRFRVYGGDLFAAVGVWALTDRRDLSVRDSSLYRALPVDLMFDAGLRIDTRIGVFELSFANAFGRLPF